MGGLANGFWFMHKAAGVSKDSQERDSGGGNACRSKWVEDDDDEGEGELRRSNTFAVSSHARQRTKRSGSIFIASPTPSKGCASPSNGPAQPICPTNEATEVISRPPFGNGFI